MSTISEKKVQRPVRATAFKQGLANEVLSLMNIHADMQVLDVGCGNGWLSYTLAETMEGKGRVVGIDVNETAINQAKNELPDFKYSNIEFHTIDVTDIPYLEQFDYVICVNSFHHLIDREKAFNKINSALNEAGELLVVDYSGDSMFMRILDSLSKDHTGPIHFLKSQELLEALNSAGFKEASVTTKRMYLIFSTMIAHAKKASSKIKPDATIRQGG
jgi:2-polyprenyl-3-methyl-5-hydroxy-6-metoxy-1,4-benzoquinol methylase